MGAAALLAWPAGSPSSPPTTALLQCSQRPHSSQGAPCSPWESTELVSQGPSGPSQGSQLISNASHLRRRRQELPRVTSWEAAEPGPARTHRTSRAAPSASLTARVVVPPSRDHLGPGSGPDGSFLSPHRFCQSTATGRSQPKSGRDKLSTTRRITTSST